MAHAGEELRLGLALAQRERALLACGLGVLALGHVPVDADLPHHHALLVLHRREARREPAVAAIGPTHAKLVAHRLTAARRGLPRLEHALAIVGVDELAATANRRERSFGLEAAQAKHLLVPKHRQRLEVLLPGAHAATTHRECRALVGFAQRSLDAMPLGDVDRDAVDERLAAAVDAVPANQHPAHFAVGAHDAQLVLVERALRVDRFLAVADYPLAIVGVNALVPPLHQRHRPIDRHAEDLSRLLVPLDRAGARVKHPDADVGRGRGELEPPRQLAAALRLLDLVGDVERDAEKGLRATVGAALRDGARQHMAAGAISAKVARLQVDRAIAVQRAACRCDDLVEIIGVHPAPNFVDAQALAARRETQQLPAAIVVVQALGGEVVTPGDDIEQLARQLQVGRGFIEGAGEAVGANSSKACERHQALAQCRRV